MRTKAIGTILGRRFFALSTEELILELAVLTAKMVNFRFEVLGPMHSPSVLSLPILGLPPQLENLPPGAAPVLRDEVVAPVPTNQPARRPERG